jgi:hypothetical protein
MISSPAGVVTMHGVTSPLRSSPETDPERVVELRAAGGIAVPAGLISHGHRLTRSARPDSTPAGKYSAAARPADAATPATPGGSRPVAAYQLLDPRQAAILHGGDRADLGVNAAADQVNLARHGAREMLGRDDER